MANQRPIRRPRVPAWKRGKRRPTRWNAVTNQADDAVLLNTAVMPTIPNGNPPIAVLVDGQIDVEPWADEQEVTLDRIVGNLAFHGYFQSYFPSGTYTLANKVPYLKVGIVLLEELSKDPASNVPTRNLFDQEDLEDTEWMWLWSGFPEHFVQANVAAAIPNDGQPTNNIFTKFVLNIPVDIRNRRKIGQNDQLALYAEWASPSPEYDISVQSYTDVRCILMSR